MTLTESSEQSDATAILPGAVIGMVGGGQLGRMFAIAAAQMGYSVVIFCENENDPAAQVAHRCVIGPLDDHARVKSFAEQCDVITLEFENIPADTIELCESFAPTYPSASVLAVAQHRLTEKRTLTAAGLPVAPFAEVTDMSSLELAARTTGWPMILKTAVCGYDGKGQHRLDAINDAEKIDWESCDLWCAEKVIPFDREVSVIVARCADGRTKAFPVFENSHRNHILDITSVPANLSSNAEARAIEIAITASQALDVVGLLCVEMFVCGETILVNEVAPRPHNSGHLTIEACHTSQFQQHVRAVCGLPLGQTAPIANGAAMANLLGDLWNEDNRSPDWSAMLKHPGVNLHLYGKPDARPGRKMGHLTCVANSETEAIKSVVAARRSVQ